MTPLAWKNLAHNRVRTAIGMAGVGFAAMLLFMQLGFRGAIESTATQTYAVLDFDLLLRSPAYLHLTEARSFPSHRLRQAAAHPAVRSVKPFYVGLSEWRAPSTPCESDSQDVVAGLGRGIMIMGVEPTAPPFKRTDLNDTAASLTSESFVAIDTKSKPEYGPSDCRRFGPADVGVQTELGGAPVEVVGLFELGTGMASNGACMASPQGFRRACPWIPAGEVTMGLVTLAKNADPQRVADELERAFGSEADVEVLPRYEVEGKERVRWMEETPFGMIFTLGVAVAIFVGVAIVYQVLSNDIANMMSEYATLKAIGYSNAYLASVVLKQSVLLALVGYLPALAVSWLLYGLIGQAAGIPMAMTPYIAAVVGLLSAAMCVASGVFALRRLFQADPAELF